MSIWTNTISMPVGSTGFAIQNQAGTGIQIQPIDPRIFQYGSYGGGQSRRSTGQSSSSSSSKSDKLDLPDGPTGMIRDIVYQEEGLKIKEQNLHNKYMNKMLDENINDYERQELEKQYQQEQNELFIQKMNLPVIKNAVKRKGEQLNQARLQAKGLENQIAFNANFGSIRNVDDMKMLSIDQNGVHRYLTSVEVDDKNNNARLLTIGEYFDNYDKYSRATLDGGVTDLRIPELNMDNPLQFKNNISNELKDASTEVFNTLVSEGHNAQELFSSGYFSNIINTDKMAVQSLTSNEQNLHRIIDNMFDRVSDNTRNAAYSHVLSTKVHFNTKEKVENKIQHPTEDRFLTKEELKARNLPEMVDKIIPINGQQALLQYETNLKKYYDALNSTNEEEKAKADTYLKEANRYGEAIINTAKEYVVGTALNSKVGLVQRSVKVTDTAGEGLKSDTTYMEALLSNVTPNPMAVAVRFDPKNPDKLNYKSFYGGQAAIPTDVRMNMLKDFGWQLDNPNVEKPSITQSAIAIVNGVPINTEMIKTKDQSSKIIELGNVVNMYPDYMLKAVDAEKYPGMYGIDTGLSQAYVEVKIQADKNTMIPVYDNNKLVWKKFSEVASDKEGQEKYPSLNIDKDAMTFTVNIPAPQQFLSDPKGSNNETQLQLNKLRQERIASRTKEINTIQEENAKAKFEKLKSTIDRHKSPGIKLQEQQLEQVARQLQEPYSSENVDKSLKLLMDFGYIVNSSGAKNAIENNVFKLRQLEAIIGKSKLTEEMYRRLNPYADIDTMMSNRIFSVGKR